MKPLDFVRPVPGSVMRSNDPAYKEKAVGIISEVSPPAMYTDGKMHVTASVVWIGGSKGLKTAWWDQSELIVIDNLPNVLARRMAHPFGNNGSEDIVDKFFPIGDQ